SPGPRARPPRHRRQRLPRHAGRPQASRRGLWDGGDAGPAGRARPPAMTAGGSGAQPFWVLLLQRDSPDSLYEAAAMTAAAVSLRPPVTLLSFPPPPHPLASDPLA